MSAVVGGHTLHVHGSAAGSAARVDDGRERDPCPRARDVIEHGCDITAALYARVNLSLIESMRRYGARGDFHARTRGNVSARDRSRRPTVPR
jgi:hypothetical protein